MLTKTLFFRIKKVRNINEGRALKGWRYRQEIYRKQFRDNLFLFEEAKVGEDPVSMNQKIMESDHAVCRLQELQQMYNFKVLIRFDDTSTVLTLAYCVKMVSFAGEAEKRWRSAATDNGRERYSSREISRRSDEEYATKQVSITDAINEAEKQSRSASILREKIALANNTEIDFEIDEKEINFLFGLNQLKSEKSD